MSIYLIGSLGYCYILVRIFQGQGLFGGGGGQSDIVFLYMILLNFDSLMKGRLFFILFLKF